MKIHSAGGELIVVDGQTHIQTHEEADIRFS